MKNRILNFWSFALMLFILAIVVFISLMEEHFSAEVDVYTMQSFIVLFSLTFISANFKAFKEVFEERSLSKQIIQFSVKSPIYLLLLLVFFPLCLSFPALIQGDVSYFTLLFSSSFAQNFLIVSILSKYVHHKRMKSIILNGGVFLGFIVVVAPKINLQELVPYNPIFNFSLFPYLIFDYAINYHLLFLFVLLLSILFFGDRKVKALK